MVHIDHRLLNRLELGQHLATEPCQLDVARPTQEERAAKLALELLDGAGQRRLTDTAGLGCAGEVEITSQSQKIADLVNGSSSDTPWMIWVETDYDADSIMSLLPSAVEVRGNMKPEMKEERLDGFSTGDIRILVSKPKIAGMGLNWQHCNNTAFVGLSFSYEQYYQAVRRFWRFGQKNQVNVHVALAETEQKIWSIIQRKKKDHEEMKLAMFEAMKKEALGHGVKNNYYPTQAAKMPSFL